MGKSATLADIHAAIACLGRLTEVYGQRRQELALMFDVYKQAIEQDRIPRRTPEPEEPEA